MAKIPYRGKEVNMVSVGKSKAYDVTTWQAALDRVEGYGDAAPGNQYIITVAPGIYTEKVTWPNAPYTTIVGESRKGSVLYQADDATDTATLVINDETNVPTFIGLENLTVVASGGATATPAVALGHSGGAAAGISSDIAWQDLHFMDCDLIGPQAGIKAYGVEDTASAVPRLLVQGCRLVGLVDTFQMSLGDVAMVLRGNHHINAYAPTRGWDLDPMLTFNGDFEVADIPVRSHSAIRLSNAGGSFTAFDLASRVLCINELYDIHYDEDCGGTAGHRRLSAVRVGHAQSACPPIRFVGCNALVSYDQDDGTLTAGRFTGMEISGATEIPEDTFLWQGGYVHLLQESNGNFTGDMPCINNGSTHANGAHIKIVGATLKAEDKGSATPQSMRSEGDASNVTEHHVFSDEPTDAESGSITALSAVA